MKVVILEAAEADLQELRRYIIKNFSTLTWQETFNKLKEAIRNLAAFPYLGAIPPELEALHLVQYRQLLFGKKPHHLRGARRSGLRAHRRRYAP